MTDARENLLRTLLEKIATEQKYDNPDIKTTDLPATGANFSSQLFHATIKSKDKENLNIFAKVAVIGETLRQQAGSPIFDIEPHFYSKLAKTYKEIEDKHDVPEEHRLVVPKFYGHSNEYLKEVLVLEDLTKDGFETYDRLKSIDWDYASKAIEELAKLHALSLAYEKEYPEDYEAGKKILKRIMIPESGPMQEMFIQMMVQVLQMIREENRPKMQKFFEAFSPTSYKQFYDPRKIPVIIHSDFRQSNLMHKIDENGQLQVVVVDYQTLHPGSVVIDLLYFIFTGSDGAFRAQYYDQLIDHYYKNLAAALKRLDLDSEEVFPRSDFDEELKELLPFGLVIASTMLPMITMDLAQVSQGDGSEFERESFEDMAQMLSKTNELCARRLNEVVDDYVKWGVI